MSRVKYANKVFRLVKPMTVNFNGIPEPLTFKLGEEFHIVADVLYMNGFPLAAPFQQPIINWIESNPRLFVDDTRKF
jgi:hypothetical protein